MEEFLKIFHKKDQAVAPNPLQPNALKTPLRRATTPPRKATTPHIVPPIDNWNSESNPEHGFRDIANERAMHSTTKRISKSKDSFPGLRGTKTLGIEDNKKRVVAAVTKKQASVKKPLKYYKHLSYKQHLKKLIGIDSDLDDGVPLWEESESDSEDEEAIRHARSRGF